jgi:hypothetical protein
MGVRAGRSGPFGRTWIEDGRHELENRYGSLAHREFKSLTLSDPDRWLQIDPLPPALP